MMSIYCVGCKEKVVVPKDELETYITAPNAKGIELVTKRGICPRCGRGISHIVGALNKVEAF